ncbi:PA2928 family protein [Phenylobacterium terrae]|uniref:PA2928 family protein n=1 Tax=Phenylobacterium terrae TaxID=2665495 RepID=A0ABW4N0Q7_9CAUL
MSYPIVSRSRPGALNRLILVLALIGALTVATVIVLAILIPREGDSVTPADVIGAPVRAQTAAGDRIFLLTSQWLTTRPYVGRRSANRPTYVDLLIDVWAFDATDGRLVWRRQLEADRSGLNMGRAVLGVDARAVWVLAGDGLVGLSPADGATVADVARLEAANPQLKGRIPREPDYYQFDQGGLWFTAADARRWRLAGPGLQARPEAEPAGPAEVFAPARWSGGVSTWMFHERGVRLGDRWLGVLSEREAAASAQAEELKFSSVQDEPLVRLWSAYLTQAPTHFGSRTVYARFEPLPQSPEFIQGGLLSDGKDNAPPILLTGPDSVLVLHRDRLGADGRWQVSRIAGPDGRRLWTAPLPMARFDAVMPGKTTLAIQGSQPEPDPRRGRSGETEDIDHLVVIDLASGRTIVQRLAASGDWPEK